MSSFSSFEGPHNRIFEHSSICSGNSVRFQLFDEEASWTSLHSTILAGNVDDQLMGPVDSLLITTSEKQDENLGLNTVKTQIKKDNLEPVKSSEVISSDDEAYFQCLDKSFKYVLKFF